MITRETSAGPPNSWTLSYDHCLRYLHQAYAILMSVTTWLVSFSFVKTNGNELKVVV